MIISVPLKPRTRNGSSLADVARIAGVSVATASRVLNGENKELWAGTAARADKIRKVAEKLGYRPDWRARALRVQKTSSIGVVYSEVNPMMDMTSYGPMFREFGAVLQNAGYHMMFVHVPRITGVQPASMLQAVDAAVYYHNITAGQVEAAKVVRGPSILINCEPKLPYPRVDPDDVGGATALTKHLLDLGHRRIAWAEHWVPGAEFDHHSRVVRRDVVQRTMSEAGCGSGFCVWDASITTPYRAIVDRFRGTLIAERPTAMIVPYSIQAVCMLNEFIRQGIRVPEELSFATFDDHHLVDQAIVPMTTVAVPMEQVGQTSAELILRLLQSPNHRSNKSIVLPERLVIRQSTGIACR